MILNYYKATELEQWISKKYKAAGIRCAADMDLDHIADIFGVEVHTYAGRSIADWRDGEYAFILLNADLDPRQLREQFFHELCHPLRHCGRQDTLPVGLKELQEQQAAAFQLYAAMPVYMLGEFGEIQQRETYIMALAEAFALPPSFVEKRVAQIERRILQAKMDEETYLAQNPVHITYEYMPETQRILTQLRRQLDAKKGAVG